MIKKVKDSVKNMYRIWWICTLITGLSAFANPVLWGEVYLKVIVLFLIFSVDKKNNRISAVMCLIVSGLSLLAYLDLSFGSYMSYDDIPLWKPLYYLIAFLMLISTIHSIRLVSKTVKFHRINNIRVNWKNSLLFSVITFVYVVIVFIVSDMLVDYLHVERSLNISEYVLQGLPSACILSTIALASWGLLPGTKNIKIMHSYI